MLDSHCGPPQLPRNAVHVHMDFKFPSTRQIRSKPATTRRWFREDFSEGMIAACSEAIVAEAIKSFRVRAEMELHIADEKLQEWVLVVIAGGTFESVAALRLLKQICDMATEKHVNKILVDALALDGDGVRNK